MIILIFPVIEKFKERNQMENEGEEQDENCEIFCYMGKHILSFDFEMLKFQVVLKLFLFSFIHTERNWC